jgi:hypothetical protein
VMDIFCFCAPFPDSIFTPPKAKNQMKKQRNSGRWCPRK